MATVFVTCYRCHPRYFNYYTFIPKTKQNKKIKQTYEAILKFPRTPTLWLFWLINNNSILDFFSVSTKKEKEVTHGTWRKFATHFHQFEIFLDWVTLFIFLCPAMSENCDVPKCRFFTGLDFEIIPYDLTWSFSAWTNFDGLEVSAPSSRCEWWMVRTHPHFSASYRQGNRCIPRRSITFHLRSIQTLTLTHP